MAERERVSIQPLRFLINMCHVVSLISGRKGILVDQTPKQSYSRHIEFIRLSS